MTQNNNTQPTGRRFWFRLVLGISLALNLLIIGLAAGAAYRFSGPDGTRRPPPSLGAMLYRELPRADRRAFRKAMQAAPTGHTPDWGAEAQELGAALRASPFDAGAVAAIVARHAHHRSSWQDTATRLWMDRIATMTDAERDAYSQRVQDALIHNHHNHHRPDRREKSE